MIVLTNSCYVVKLPFLIWFLLKFLIPSHTKIKKFTCAPRVFEKESSSVYGKPYELDTIILSGYRLYTLKLEKQMVRPPQATKKGTATLIHKTTKSFDPLSHKTKKFTRAACVFEKEPSSFYGKA